MKATFDRKQLLSALGEVSIALTPRIDSPVSGCVLIVAKRESAELICDCVQIRAESRIDATVDQPGSFIVSHSKLTALLQRDVERVGISADGGRVLVKLGENSDIGASLPSQDADIFPPARKDGEQSVFASVDGQAFCQAVHIAAACTSASRGVEWYEGVQIKDNGQQMQISGGDGRHFSRSTLKSCESEFETVIPAKTIKSAIGRFSACDALSLIVSENSLKIASESLTVYLQPMAVKYGAMDKIVKEVDLICANSVEINRDALVNALQTASAVLDADDHKILATIANNSLSLEAASSSAGSYSESLECEAEVPMPVVGFNRTLLVPFLKMIDWETLVLKYGTGAPVVKLTPKFGNEFAYYLCLMRA